MYNKIKNVMLLSLVSGLAFAQRRGRVGNISKVDQVLQQADAPVNNIINTIINWCYGLIILGAIVGSVIIIFTSGRGEDKIMKFGNLLFILLAIFVIVAIADMLF